MVVLSLIIGFLIVLVYSPETSVLSDQIANTGKVMAITGVLILTTLHLFGVFWFFYRLLYGILPEDCAIKELRKIDL
jgi:hypothetical protein